ncbi:hypothetical protein G9A89_004625 [Geosiphon pyriformis]|nr:hypothetical protein G9A89_004625 [Geosiphon pyriformis]
MVQQPVESNPEEYKNESNNPVTAQAKSMVNKKPKVLSPTTPSYYQTFQREYRSLFGNLIPAAGQTEGNLSTWEQPPAQNLAESASLLTKETAILQLIGSSDKGKQPALAPREHSNTWTPIPLNITSNTPSINQIMAYQNIAKLEKFSGEEDNAYSWITDTEKAITANSWNDDHTIQALPFFLTGTANSCIIKQKDHKAVTTYLGQFNQILHQILAIERNYYTAVQVLNQFIKELWSSILRSIRPRHPTSLQDAVILARDFKSAEQKANHTQAVNLAINGTSDIDTKITQLSEKLTQKIKGFLAGTTGTYQPPQWRKNNNNSRYPQQQNCQQQQQLWRSDLCNYYYCQKPGHIAHDCRRKIMDQNQGNLYQQPRYQQNMSFDKSTPVERGDIEQISQPSKQTKSNIPPATITEDITLAAIFPFDIDNLNTHSLFSGAAINQNKPIMALYTNARVGGIDIKLILDSGSASSIIMKQFMDQLDRQVDRAATARIITADRNTKTPIGEIDNFLFKINGIQIPTKHARVPTTCEHFKTQCTKKPLIEFEDTSMPPTIETYQISWMNDYQTELPPPPTWEEKRKGRAKE